MSTTLLLTGATGALGVPLLVELVRTRAFRQIIALARADTTALHAALRRESPGIDLTGISSVSVELGSNTAAAALTALPTSIDCVIHAAACTKFRAPAAQLIAANLEGTRQILTWAATLPCAPRVLHFSTTCVAGQRTGAISESPLKDEVGFVNDYERTKWGAEQLVAASPLRPEIVRLATVVGSTRDGHLQRTGAFHTTLRWLHAGLLPMIPGDASTRLDLLPTELVTGFVSRLIARPPEPSGIYHVSCGTEGVPLGEMLDFAAEKFSARSAAWRGGQILAPVLAPRAAFEDFRATILKSRDFLFTQVLESVDSFLPELFYPKQYATTRAEAVWGGPLPRPDWREWLGRVIDYALDSDFGRKETSAVRV
jgi:nucleoside-diphosphate-sugar epimerase